LSAPVPTFAKAAKVGHPPTVSSILAFSLGFEVFDSLPPFVQRLGLGQGLKPYAKSTYEQAVPKTYKWYLFGIGALNSSSIATLRLNEIRTEKIAEFVSELQRKEKSRAKGKHLQLATI